jgi:D-alanine-D-alanine ligase
MQIGLLVADRSHETARARGGSSDSLERGLLRLALTVQAVRAALADLGHTVTDFPVNRGLLERLVETAPPLVFNTYFGPARRLDQAHASSILEFAGVPFTGGDAACHFLGLSKPFSKRIFSAAALPTPRGFAVPHPDETERLLAASGLRFPLIAKAPAEGEGIGIDTGSVARSRGELVDAVRRILDRFALPALVEEFLPGREFTVGILDGDAPRVLPILEIILGAEQTYSFQAKTHETTTEVCPAEITAPEAELMGGLAVRAGRVLGCRDYWRVDFRQDSLGAPHILEVNTLPGLQPGYSDFTKMAGPAGLEYAQIVAGILESARRRLGG